MLQFRKRRLYLFCQKETPPPYPINQPHYPFPSQTLHASHNPWRCRLHTLGAVVSTPHLAMKFPSPSSNILTIHYDQRLARECYMASLRPQLPIQQANHIEQPPGSGIALSGDNLDPRVGRDVRLEPIEETIPLELPNGHSIKLGQLSTYPELTLK